MFCKNKALINLKIIFNSFNKLREPAKSLIHLFNGAMIKAGIITKEEGDENEKKI